MERPRDNEGSPGSQGYAGAAHPEDVQRPRMTPATIAAKVMLTDKQAEAYTCTEAMKAKPLSI